MVRERGRNKYSSQRITIGEITREVVRKQSKNAEGAVRLTLWLNTLRTKFADRTFLVDDAVTAAWGRIAAIRSRNIADVLIAVTAIVLQLTLVTRGRFLRSSAADRPSMESNA